MITAREWAQDANDWARREFGLGNPQYALQRTYALATGYVNARPKERYRRLPMGIDLTEEAIAYCVNLGLPASRVYVIYVHRMLVWDARKMAEHWSSPGPNPLGPRVHIIEDEKLEPYEWFIEAHGRSEYAFGSKGAG